MDGIKNSDNNYRTSINIQSFSQDRDNVQMKQVNQQYANTSTAGSKRTTDGSPDKAIREPNFDKIVDKLNESAQLVQKKFKYQIHDETNRLMIQVVDADSSEVIREIPPEKVLDMMAKIEKMIGLIIDEKI